MEQGYISAWRMSQTALINRNSLLKQKAVQVESAQINAWTHELSHYAQQIDNFRLNYIAELEVALAETLTPLIALDTLKLKYFRGWDKAASLEEVLNRDLSKDRKLGFTSAGPHRADIKIQLGRQAAADVLSRGQQKLLVIAMKMAQATLLKKYSEQGCIFLADDLPAELDATNRGRVLALLAGLEEQVFVTGVDKTQLYEPLQNINELQLFHVKHGRIESV